MVVLLPQKEQEANGNRPARVRVNKNQRRVVMMHTRESRIVSLSFFEPPALLSSGIPTRRAGSAGSSRFLLRCFTNAARNRGGIPGRQVVRLGRTLTI